MPAMHLEQLSFTYSACGSFTKNKERIEKLCRQEMQILLTRMILLKSVSTWYKDLAKRTQTDKVLRNEAFEDWTNYHKPINQLSENIKEEEFTLQWCL